MRNELPLDGCRYLAFALVSGNVLGRSHNVQGALDMARLAGMDDPEGVEVLDCGQEGRKIWLQCISGGMPIFLAHARRRHTTVYRGAFYDRPDVYGANAWPAVPLTPSAS